jgi:hypothetical protein
MKNYILLLLITFSGITQAQTKKITFDYDAAGNQINRTLVCINCKTLKQPGEEPKEIAAIKEEDLQQFAPGDAISYYPNPVREELYLQWQSTNDTYVKTVTVYSFNGQQLKSYTQTASSNNQTIAFQPYPSGVYLVVLMYNSGDQKTIKIIKK